MVTLEQIKLLETKIVKAITIVEQAAAENAQLSDENTQLKIKLETYQKRIDELEGLIQAFKDEQGKIEEGIVSALNRLNRFEAAIEVTIKPPDTEEYGHEGYYTPGTGASPHVQEAEPPAQEQSGYRDYQPTAFEPITGEARPSADPPAAQDSPERHPQQAEPEGHMGPDNGGFNPVSGWQEEPSEVEDYQEQDYGEAHYFDTENYNSQPEESSQGDSGENHHSSELDIF